MKKVIQLPEGPTNLKELFPEVYFPDVTEWKIQAIDIDNNIIGTSSLNKPDLICDIRFHFINSCGQLDSLNFRHSERIHETKSDLCEQSQNVIFDRATTGRMRQGIKSDENFEFETSFYLDKDLPFLKDFVNSPLVFVEMQVENSTERAYLPFILEDSRIPQKGKDIYEYQIQIKGYLANSRINFR